MMRPTLLLSAAIIALLAQRSSAQIDYPHAKVVLVTDAAPGEGADIFVRNLTVHLGPVMNVEFAVENIVGEYGREAMDRVASSPADGSVIFVLTNDALKAWIGTPPDAAMRALDPVAIMLYDPLVIYTAAAAPWRTLAELIEHAKANPGKMAWGSDDMASYGHLAMEKLAVNAGLDVSVKAYGSARDLMRSVEAGKADIGIGEIHDIEKGEQGGRVRILAPLTAKRLASRPEIPTAMEEGDVVISYLFRGFAGPKGLPDDLARFWHRSLVKVSKLPEFRQGYARDSLAEHVMNRTETRQAVDYLAQQLRTAVAAVEGKAN